MKFVFLACTLSISYFFASAQPAVIPQSAESYIINMLDKDLLFDTIQIVKKALTPVAEADTENAWKAWRTIENFTYGKDRGSLPMIADLQSLHPFFRDKISQLIEVCKAQGIELAVVESFRTHAKQAEYFGMGRKYTRSKGGKSKHQYGLAADVVPVVNSVAVWDNAALWKKIGVAGERLGLRWGGRWRAPYDPAHFEWSGGVNTYQLANGAQPMIPKSKVSAYPCLNEELEMLQRFRELWEAEQAVMARSSNAGRPTTVSAEKP